MSHDSQACLICGGESVSTYEDSRVRVLDCVDFPACPSCVTRIKHAVVRAIGHERDAIAAEREQVSA